jgi:LmbE family N-acetylglucosaminyl deacetylase
MRIACIHAHPDDAEILAGGTLALLARHGHQITIVTMTAGDCGSAEFGPEEIATMRQAEAAEAAACIGAEYRWAGFRDLAIFNDDGSRRSVTGLLREICPDVVLTASPADYHCDHEATSQLVQDACFGASVPNYQTAGSAPPLEAIPHLYFLDPIEMADRNGSVIIPDFVINIESTFELKKTMLAKHASQRAWLRKQHGLDDYLNQMEEWTRAGGARAGIAFGEGFRQYRVHPFPRTTVLQDLLRRYVVTSS